MKKQLTVLIFIFLFSQLHSQDNEDQTFCNYLVNELKEKPLKCMDKSKIKNDQVIYQFFRWSAFKESYFFSIEKNGNIQKVVKKKIYNPSYDEKTGEYIKPKIEILKQKKLSHNESKDLVALLDRFQFWQKNDYKVKPLCNDGGGVKVYAIRKDDYLEVSNGNCSPQNEYLNVLYRKVEELLKI